MTFNVKRCHNTFIRIFKSSNAFNKCSRIINCIFIGCKWWKNSNTNFLNIDARGIICCEYGSGLNMRTWVWIEYGSESVMWRHKLECLSVVVCLWRHKLECLSGVVLVLCIIRLCDSVPYLLHPLCWVFVSLYLCYLANVTRAVKVSYHMIWCVKCAVFPYVRHCSNVKYAVGDETIVLIIYIPSASK